MTNHCSTHVYIIWLTLQVHIVSFWTPTHVGTSAQRTQVIRVGLRKQRGPMSANTHTSSPREIAPIHGGVDRSESQRFSVYCSFSSHQASIRIVFRYSRLLFWFIQSGNFLVSLKLFYYSIRLRFWRSEAREFWLYLKTIRTDSRAFCVWFFFFFKEQFSAMAELFRQVSTHFLKQIIKKIYEHSAKCTDIGHRYITWNWGT